MFSIILVFSLVVAVNYFESPKIDGWHIVSIAGIIFLTVAFYGAFISIDHSALNFRKIVLWPKLAGKILVLSPSYAPGL